MTRLLAILLLLPAIASAAGLGVYNPAQHAVNGFMPTQLPDLQLWLDANKIGLTNGASVDVWQDFSGRSNWATNGTGSKRPIVGSINGRSSISFDGIDDFASIANFVSTTYISFFVVYKDNGGIAIVEHSPQAGPNDGFLFYGENFPWAFRRAPSGTHYANTGVKWTTNSALVGTLTYDGSGIYKRDGTIYTNGAVSGSAQSNSLTTNSLFIASRNGTTLFSKGSFSELILYTNNLDAAKQKQVERYLGNKYGIVVQ